MVPPDIRQAFGEAAGLLVQFARRTVADGLTVGTSGNLSCRVGEYVAITPSRIPYDRMRPEDCCLLRLDGSVVLGDHAPSSETPLHLAIYASTRAGAVVHTHSPEVVALSAACSELPAIHYAIVALGGPVPVVPYTLFGTQELASRVVAALEGRRAAVMQNHGAVTYGRSLPDAYERAVLLEWLAGVYRRALQFGPPRILSDAELADVRDAMRRLAMGPDASPEEAP
ncbi:MAG: class II aldolase/adducin family protein [Thermoflavifilum sp.]|nr:class II aldolase/adducin family protein [Thermoflavifilum sp.]MCL6514840.1 class II aldolase/adducin family protein [Alicyclobacillus sp.]